MAEKLPRVDRYLDMAVSLRKQTVMAAMEKAAHSIVVSTVESVSHSEADVYKAAVSGEIVDRTGLEYLSTEMSGEGVVTAIRSKVSEIYANTPNQDFDSHLSGQANLEAA